MPEHALARGTDMDSLYAVSLIVAIAAGVFALLTAVIGLARKFPRMEPGGPVREVLLSHRLACGALALGFISLAISVVVHSRWGHGPGTVAPMNLGRLLSEHESFIAVGAILLVALVLALYRSRRQRRG